jgi:hypothetical protein
VLKACGAWSFVSMKKAWSFDEDEGGWEYRVCALISLELDTFPLAFENNQKKSLTSPPMR